MNNTNNTQSHLRRQRVVLLGVLLFVVFMWSQQTLRAQTGETVDVVSTESGAVIESSSESSEESSDNSSSDVMGESSSSSTSVVSSESSESSTEQSSASGSVMESSSSESLAEPSSESSESSGSSESLSSSSEETSSESSSSSIAFEVSTLEMQPADLRPSNVFPSFTIGHTAQIASAEELQKRIRITLSASAGEIVEVDHEVADIDGGYRVMLVPTSTAFTPGQYRLIATLDGTRGVTRLLQRLFRNTAGDEEDEVLLDEIFQWGTVAVNTDRDAYATGDAAIISAAVISQNGMPLCIPELSATIGDNSTASVENFCNDQELELIVPADIDPTLTVHADNALRERTVQQVIEVAENQPLISIERRGDTRTVPGTGSTMQVIVTVRQDFTGRLVETVPAGFIVTDTTPIAEIDEEDGRTTITWEGAWLANAPRTVSYSFTTPAATPIFGLFGPIEMRGEMDADTEVIIEASSSSSEEVIESSSSSSEEVIESSSSSSEDSDATADISSASSESFESSASSFSEATEEVIEEPETSSGSTSFIESFFNSIVAALIVDDSTTYYTENRQWQMISVEGESGTWEEIRERTLLLQRTAQVFDAQTTPSFTLVDTEIPHTGSSTTLSTEIAVEEILHAVISEEDIQDSSSEELTSDELVIAKQELIETVAVAVADEESAIESAAEKLNQEVPTEELKTGTASVIMVTLVGPNGLPIENPRFHFKQGSVVLVIDPITNFTPGLYTLTVLITNPVTGEVTTMHQQFAWGVLALNANKDVYGTDDVASIHIGVLDNMGEIVCTADLTLDVVTPSGETINLSTEDESIMQSSSCAKKEAGFIDPDFYTSFALPEEGTYQLTLTAVTENGTRQLASEIVVNDESMFSVERHAATRLWPFAPSPMDITVTFNRDIDGTIVEYLPAGFEADEISEDGETQTLEDGTTVIRWHGSWEAGETLELHYEYDAPDISPQFYLVGPLRIFSTTPLTPEQ